MWIIQPIRGLLEATIVPEIVVDDIGAVSMANGLTEIVWSRSQEMADNPSGVPTPVSQARMIIPSACLPQILAKLVMCILPVRQGEQEPRSFTPRIVS